MDKDGEWSRSIVISLRVSRNDGDFLNLSMVVESRNLPILFTEKDYFGCIC